MRLACIFSLALALSFPCAAQAPSAEEKAAITQTALDYIEGWYTSNAARMERALHPDLAKRIVRQDPNTGQSVLGHMTAAQLIEMTRRKSQAESSARKEVTILDVYGNAAVVKVDAERWVDYLQVAKWNGQWKIINVLWELRPPAK